MSSSGRIHQAFGLCLCSSFALPELGEPGGPGAVDVDVSAASVPILRLRAPIHLPAAAIADTIEHALYRARAHGSAA